MSAFNQIIRKALQIAHVIIVIKSEVSTLQLLWYFSVVVCLRCLLHHILSLIAYVFRGNRDFDSLSLCSLWWMRWYVLACRSYSFVCNGTYKMHVRYILSSVWVRLSIFSQLSIIQYMGLCAFNLPISLVRVEIMYILSYYHHQIGSMNYYCLGLGHETMVCAVCLSIFLFTWQVY